MKIQIISDLHLSVAGMPLPVTDADLVILAGDISRPQTAIAWARDFPQPVVYIPGNHEYYGGSLTGVRRQLQALAAGSNIHVLDHEVARFGRVRILGCTLWSDFGLYSDAQLQHLAKTEAVRLMHDFTKVRITDDGPDLFTPAMSAQLFERAATWLRKELQSPHHGITVVVTHHAPCTKSVHPKYRTSPITPAFVSNLDELVASSGAALWIHGHVHDSYDYDMGATRVVCNPRGYGKDGSSENPQFDPTLCVTIVT